VTKEWHYRKQSLACFWPLNNRFGLFLAFFSTVWLFIEIFIWQPCRLLEQLLNIPEKVKKSSLY